MENVCREILTFWFGDDQDDAETAAAKAELWWGHSPATDEALQERFGAVRPLARQRPVCSIIGPGHREDDSR